MPESVLDLLLSDDLLANASAITTGPALRKFFSRRQEVLGVREALVSGQITDQHVQEFTERLLADLGQGALFCHDLTLGALAVAIEERATPEVDQFLRGLAELQLAEMPLGPRVAREVLSQRFRLAANQTEVTSLAPPPGKVVRGYQGLASLYPPSSENQTQRVELG